MGFYWKLFRFKFMNPERRASWVQQEFDVAKRVSDRESRKQLYRQLLDVRSEYVGGGGNELTPEVDKIFDEIDAAFEYDLHASFLNRTKQHRYSTARVSKRGLTIHSHWAQVDAPLAHARGTVPVYQCCLV